MIVPDVAFTKVKMPPLVESMVTVAGTDDAAMDEPIWIVFVVTVPFAELVSVPFGRKREPPAESVSEPPIEAVDVLFKVRAVPLPPLADTSVPPLPVVNEPPAGTRTATAFEIEPATSFAVSVPAVGPNRTVAPSVPKVTTLCDGSERTAPAAKGFMALTEAVTPEVFVNVPAAANDRTLPLGIAGSGPAANMVVAPLESVIAPDTFELRLPVPMAAAIDMLVVASKARVGLNGVSEIGAV